MTYYNTNQEPDRNALDAHTDQQIVNLTDQRKRLSEIEAAHAHSDITEPCNGHYETTWQAFRAALAECDDEQ